MRLSFEIPHQRLSRSSARAALLVALALVSTSFGLAGLVERGPEFTGHSRWSCTGSGSLVEVHPGGSGAARACTARELHDGGLWEGVL